MPVATILIADPDALTRRVVRMMLEEHGYAVEEAADLATAAMMAPGYDLVVLDGVCAADDGASAAQALRASDPDRYLPILALTSAAVDEEHVYLEAGMDGFLMKPVSGDELLGLVGRCLNDDPTRSTRTRSR